MGVKTALFGLVMRNQWEAGGRGKLLLSLENLDAQSRGVIYTMQFIGDDEMHGPRKRWSDPH